MNFNSRLIRVMMEMREVVSCELEVRGKEEAKRGKKMCCDCLEEAASSHE